MIPKTIHYCWFGRGEKPPLAKKCIASWKKHCPDYEIIEWNEDNFDVNMNGYTKMCFKEKKWAFLSDYVRLWLVYEYGGIYFDTDVEVLRSIDPLLDNPAFFGFETDYKDHDTSSVINTGLGFGAVKNSEAIKTMLEEYDPLLDGMHGVRMCPELNTLGLEKIGLRWNGQLQQFSWGTVYPKEYFNPYESNTGRLVKTEHTYSVHWYMGSCLSRGAKLRSMITKPLHRILGVNCFAWLRRR